MSETVSQYILPDYVDRKSEIRNPDLHVLQKLFTRSPEGTMVDLLHTPNMNRRILVGAMVYDYPEQYAMDDRASKSRFGHGISINALAYRTFEMIESGYTSKEETIEKALNNYTRLLGNLDIFFHAQAGETLNPSDQEDITSICELAGATTPQEAFAVLQEWYSLLYGTPQSDKLRDDRFVAITQALATWDSAGRTQKATFTANGLAKIHLEDGADGRNVAPYLQEIRCAPAEIDTQPNQVTRYTLLPHTRVNSGHCSCCGALTPPLCQRRNIKDQTTGAVNGYIQETVDALYAIGEPLYRDNHRGRFSRDYAVYHWEKLGDKAHALRENEALLLALDTKDPATVTQRKDLGRALYNDIKASESSLVFLDMAAEEFGGHGAVIDWLQRNHPLEALMRSHLPRPESASNQKQAYEQLFSGINARYGQFFQRLEQAQERARQKRS